MRVLQHVLPCLLPLFPLAASFSGEQNGLFSGRDTSGIEELVARIEGRKDPWRVTADERIDRLRKADLTIQVVDEKGVPLPNAKVRIELTRHAFRFGGVLNAKLAAPATPAGERYRQFFIDFGFNAAGFDNALKIKQRRGNEELLPGVFEWLGAHKIPARGHCLIWPGVGNMPGELEKLVAAWQKSKDDATKEKIRAFCEQMVAEWAAKWDVFEWDVINEPRGKHAVQDILGADVVTDWFRIARERTVNRNCLLLVNENRVISDPKPGVKTSNIERYYSTVKYLLDRGAPVTGLGFQSRFRTLMDAETIYQRLSLFDDLKLPISATEFEIKDEKMTELQKAEVTERVMTVYFSHHLVSGIYAWSLWPGGEFAGEIADGEGRPNLRGRMWLYLMKNRWATREEAQTDAQGRALFRGFKGDYRVTAAAGKGEQCQAVQLVKAASVRIQVSSSR